MKINPTRNKRRLPRGMRARLQRSGEMFYYFEPSLSPGRKELALGSDFKMALLHRAKILLGITSIGPGMLSDFLFVSSLYLEAVVPTQEIHDRDENRKCIERLQRYFSDNQLCFDMPTIIGCKTFYMEWRGSLARIRSQREWSLLSVLLKWTSVSLKNEHEDVVQ